jgi:hypothetical protein
MPVILEARSGPHAGNRILLKQGQLVRIGRTISADFVFACDSHMSGLHFSVEASDKGCRLSDLNSRNGTWLCGQSVPAALLTNGDSFTAGETAFAVIVGEEDAASIPAQPAAAKPSADSLPTLLRNNFQPLYAILDAARDIRALALMIQHQEECQSLYEGVEGATQAQVAPYLVRLQKDSRLVEALVKEGWGKSWGVYLTGSSDFREVRHHLRHFLIVKMPGGEQVYFRFYDPRVLRAFLPTCTPEETTRFFGPIRSYLVEDENPTQLFQFVNTGKGSAMMITSSPAE